MEMMQVGQSLVHGGYRDRKTRPDTTESDKTSTEGKEDYEGTVLLVEDDEDVRSALSDILDRDRYRVVEARTYTEAVDKLDADVDIALIDYRLPDGDGIELLSRIQDKRPTLPIIIMTGYGTEDIAVKSFRTGATDYVKKPINFQFLLRTIADKLGRESVLADSFEEPASKKESVLIDEVAIYLQENHGQNMSLEKVAEVCGMSRFRFCRLFKDKFGTGYAAYLNGIRVEHAKKLLRNPDLSILDAGHAAGFGSLSQFERVFREVEGVAPREYRKGKKA